MSYRPMDWSSTYPVEIIRFNIDGTTFRRSKDGQHKPDDVLFGRATLQVTKNFVDGQPGFATWELRLDGVDTEPMLQKINRSPNRMDCAAFRGDSHRASYTGCIVMQEINMPKGKTADVIFVGATELKELVKVDNDCPTPYVHPTELRVGDRIKTDICPEGLKWDMRILKAFIVKDSANGVTTTDLEEFHLRKAKSTMGQRTFIVFEQFGGAGNTGSVLTMERHQFAEHLEEHRIRIYKEPTASDLMDGIKNLLYKPSKPSKFPEMLFASEEAYRILDSKLERGMGPNGMVMVYDGVPIYEVPRMGGIRIWAPGEGWQA